MKSTDEIAVIANDLLFQIEALQEQEKKLITEYHSSDNGGFTADISHSNNLSMQGIISVSSDGRVEFDISTTDPDIASELIISLVKLNIKLEKTNGHN